MIWLRRIEEDGTVRVRGSSETTGLIFDQDVYVWPTRLLIVTVALLRRILKVNIRGRDTNKKYTCFTNYL